MSKGKCRYQVSYGALRVKPCGKPSKPGHPRGYCEEHANQTAKKTARGGSKR